MDGVVNALDLALMRNAFGKTAETPQYNANADFNNDQVINDFLTLPS